MSQPMMILNDGRQMPQLGMGVWKMSPDETADAVAEALKIGYRLIDGAAMYGNEAGLGQAVREASVPRDQIFVTTKVWNDSHGRDRTMAAFDATMDRLALDYLDLYLIHWPSPAHNLYVETWKTLIELRDSGRVRSIGVANFHAEHLRRLIDETGVTPVLNQIELHPTFTQPALRKVNADLGIVTQSWAPLGRAAALQLAPIVQIAERLGATPAQVVIAWHLSHGLSVIPKSQNPGRQRQNFEALQVSLTPEDIAAIDALDTGERIGPDPLAFNG